MRVAVVGYGRMGREVAAVLRDRSHEPVMTRRGSDFPAGCPVGIDFTQPDAVLANTRAALTAGARYVIGTTGWDAQLPELERVVDETKGGVVHAANFSLGVNLFYKVVRDAARLIALGDADVMVAGGTESPISRIGMAGFIACRALSTSFNDTPQRASRPYDRDRDGFVIGEGAGIVVLETYEHAKERGAKIYAELIGYGLSGDAYHITAPAPDGDGALRCMDAAIARAGISVAEIDYINAHGTSTPMGDEIELAAVQRLVGNAAARISMSSTKSSIGHLLGAAGAVEAIFSILAMRDGVVPPTLNLDHPSVETPIDLVPHRSKRREVNVVLSNSFGFGGTNASLVFRRASDGR